MLKVISYSWILTKSSSTPVLSVQSVLNYFDLTEFHEIEFSSTLLPQKKVLEISVSEAVYCAVVIQMLQINLVVVE